MGHKATVCTMIPEDDEEDIGERVRGGILPIAELPRPVTSLAMFRGGKVETDSQDDPSEGTLIRNVEGFSEFEGLQELNGTSALGNQILARVSTHKFTSSEESEAITVLEGVRWARVRGHLKVIIETDTEAIYSFCRNRGANIAWSTTAILPDCLALIDPGVDIRICYAPRSANVVAHTIAERLMGVMSVWTWYDSPQEWLHPSLEADNTTFDDAAKTMYKARDKGKWSYKEAYEVVSAHQCLKIL
ncbi:hypothetical protein GIB67_033396 [Kingdonia uniflora]|uniref:RNase H type-1 domain-containing protein n=1 Tax=Kingdonia uniflora TaxID=39325 RepID=A0A7J7LTY5_9MAGN|nr:hypothetical protein GIB67_033396 [Kingdonia uniflora]